jgi:hypothetical protein
LEGHLAISSNDEALEVTIHTPSKTDTQIVDTKSKQVSIKKEYKRLRRKAKEVKFRKDKVLDPFKELDEPPVL